MLDMYAPVDGAPLTLGANRGASGIDGTIASAAGFAAGHQRPLVLLIGDLAFLHDLNSLAIVKQSAVPITISVLNNNGGNIFSLLPIAKHRDVFQDYFITPHDLSFGATAEQFGLSYDMCRSMGAFKTAFENHVHNEQSSIIELAIDREAGPAQMRKIATSIRERLDD